MPEYCNKKQMLYQNLRDAGCQEQFIEESIVLYENNEKKKLNDQLFVYRKLLLHDLHKVQNKIDCLDYLIYQLTNQQGEIL